MEQQAEIRAPTAGQQVAMAAAACRSPDAWKRDIIRQLQRRDRNQHTMFRDVIRFCTERHASRVEPNRCGPNFIQTNLPVAPQLHSKKLLLLLEGLIEARSSGWVRTRSHVLRTDRHFGMSGTVQGGRGGGVVVLTNRKSSHSTEFHFLFNLSHLMMTDGTLTQNEKLLEQPAGVVPAGRVPVQSLTDADVSPQTRSCWREPV